jgi:hypothetical protein
MKKKMDAKTPYLEQKVVDAVKKSYDANKKAKETIDADIVTAEADKKKITDEIATKQVVVDGKYKEMKAKNPGLKEATLTYVKATLSAGKRVFLISEVNDKSYITGFKHFITRFETELTNWKTIEDADTAAEKAEANE